MASLPAVAALHRMIVAALLLAGLLANRPAMAHEVPADVRVHVFFRPAPGKLELLLRVPLAAMTDIDIPTRGPGYLELARVDAALRDATRLWLIDNIEILENGHPLPTPRIAEARVTLPSDRSFRGWSEARAHVAGPRLADPLDLYWNQQLMDVLLEYPIASEGSGFELRLRFDRLGLRVVTGLRFLAPGGGERAFELHGDSGMVALDPRWHQAASRFAAAGFRHILDGLDHLLFLLCLLVPFRAVRPLVVIVTSFTVAHSASLAAAVLGFVPDALWFPPLVEALIAATILYTAIENVVGSRIERRWALAFAFGLIHGFGFSFALRESLQFAGDHLAAALLAFNAGVEVGQLAVLAVAVPAVSLLFRHALGERAGTLVLSALVGHAAWHWMLERGEQLLRFPLPRLDAGFLAGLLQAAMAALILLGLGWLASGVIRRWLGATN